MATSMRLSQSTAPAKAACRRTPLQAFSASRRTSVVVQASKAEQVVGRREILGAIALACAGSVLTASPAQAFLGFGEDGNLQETYATRTGEILQSVRTTLALPKDDPSKEDKVKDLRKDINNWVATYRREPKVSGRPSYSNTYSVLNALAGHYNSFGATAPIPKKRLERINKELDDATLFLSRGR